MIQRNLHGLAIFSLLVCRARKQDKGIINTPFSIIFTQGYFPQRINNPFGYNTFCHYNKSFSKIKNYYIREYVIVSVLIHLSFFLHTHILLELLFYNHISDRACCSSQHLVKKRNYSLKF